MSSRESRAAVRGSAPRRRWSKEKPPNLSDLRIVLLGKSVSENSRVGNFLLGRAAIDSEAPPDVVERVGGRLKDRHVMVINSPQLLQTNISAHQITQTVRECVYLCDPGPHAFILVLQHNDFTEEDMRRVKQVLNKFSEEAIKRTIVLTTDEDTHDAQGAPVKLNEFIQQLTTECGGGHLQLDNEIKRLISGVSQRLEEILGENTEDFLTCDVYDYAEGSSVDEEQSRSVASLRTEEDSDGCGTKMEGGNMADQHFSLVLLGGAGVGKSASGNTILGRLAFISKKSSRSVTRDVAVESGTVCGLPVNVYDTAGLSNSELNVLEIQQKYEKFLQRCESGRCVFLLVIKADRFTEKERKTVEKIEKLLGEERLKRTWILFTRGDELEDENRTIKEFIDDTEPLKKLVQKYDQRYHVFNNKKRGPTEQVKMLLRKILNTYLDTMVEGAEMMKQNPLKRKTPKNDEPAAPVSSLSSRRIVLLGKSGVGKSATGNTILGRREFRSEMGMTSVTHESSVKHATVSGRSVSVVDTPGFFHTHMNPEELMTEIGRSVYISSPGPHAFLIVFPVNMRFTDREQQIPQRIEMMFGQEVLKYSIILFTHGDQMDGESVEKLIEENSRLRDLVDQCGGRFHVFSNRDENNREQVNDLLQKIDTMIEQNGGHYRNEMYEDALRFRRKEEERRQREEEERKQQEKIERVRMEVEERVRSELERLEARRQRSTCVCS